MRLLDMPEMWMDKNTRWILIDADWATISEPHRHRLMRLMRAYINAYRAYRKRVILDPASGTLKYYYPGSRYDPTVETA